MASGNSTVCDALRNSYTPNWTDKWYPPTLRPVGARAQFVLYIIYSILTSLAIIAFVYFKYVYAHARDLKRLSVRPLAPMLITHLAFFFELQMGSLVYFEKLDSIPCRFSTLAFYILVPMLGFPLLGRMHAFYRSNNLTHLAYRIREPPIAPGQERRQRKTSLSESDSRTWITVAAKGWFGKKHNRIAGNSGSMVSSGAEDGMGDSGRQPISLKFAASSDLSHSTLKVVQVSLVEVRLLRFLSSSAGALLLTFTLLVPYLILSIAMLAKSPLVAQGCYGCFEGYLGNILNLLFALAGMVLLFISVWAVRNLPDPFGVVSEVKYACIIGGIPAIISQILSSFFPVGKTHSNWTFTFTSDIAIFYFCMMQSAVQVYMALRDSSNMQQTLTENQILDSNEFERQVLDSNTALNAAFEKHLMAEHSVESMRFYEQCRAWKLNFSDMGVKTARARARKIINLFVGDRAVFPVNISGMRIEELHTFAHDENALMAYDLFDAGLREIVDLMFRDPFRRFLRSPEFEMARTATSSVAPMGDAATEKHYPVVVSDMS